jgi:hypothetical protein
VAVAIFFKLVVFTMASAICFALPRLGTKMATRIPRMATTTSISTIVKPDRAVRSEERENFIYGYLGK